MTRARAEARELSRTLRGLSPERVDPGPIITTGLPFYGAKVGDIRKLARRWVREHAKATPEEMIALCDELWRTTVREEVLLACMILERDGEAREALTPKDFARWVPFLDNWETTDQLGMLVVSPWVVTSPEKRFKELERLAGDPSPWGRRLALVGIRSLARSEDAACFWPRTSKLILRLASEREAAMPKAISWILRENLRHCPAQVAEFVETEAERLPAVAVRETRNKLAGSTKKAREPAK